MNSDKHRAQRQRGNAMIYILLSLALIGALTMVLSRQNNNAGDTVDAEQAEIIAAQFITYASSAQSTLDGMVATGTPVSSIDFVLPSQAAFNTAPHINKFFHPDGGGFIYKGADPVIFQGVSPVPAPGWYLARFNNIEWTPTTAQDVIITAYQIVKPVCEAINKKITGSKAIPALGGSGSMQRAFLGTANSADGNEDLTAAVCPACEGYPTLCVSNAPLSAWSFYTIISGQ